MHSYVPTYIAQLDAYYFLANLYDLYSFNYLVPVVTFTCLENENYL